MAPDWIGMLDEAPVIGAPSTITWPPAPVGAERPLGAKVSVDAARPGTA